MEKIPEGISGKILIEFFMNFEGSPREIEENITEKVIGGLLENLNEWHSRSPQKKLKKVKQQKWNNKRKHWTCLITYAFPKENH